MNNPKPKVEGAAGVDQQHHGQLALLDVALDEGLAHPRGHVPVDVADVVLGLRFAQVREIHAVAVEQAAVVALQLAVEAAHNLPVKALSRAWTILGVSTTRKGEFEEALSYLKRAPDDPEVTEALAQCLYQLDMLAELQALTETKGFARLPSTTRAQITAALRP